MRKGASSVLAAWLAAWLALSAACRSEPFSEPQVLGGEEVPADVLRHGHDVYTRNCVTCHGELGDGNGPAAAGMKPAPRDFRTATFKFAGASDRALPHDDELVRIVRDGLDGTAMRPWDLHERELRAVVHYIKTFSPPGEGFRDPSREVSRPELPADPFEGREHEAILEGERLYHTVLQCNQCHPTYVGPAHYEAWEFPLPRADAPYRPAPRYSPAYEEVLLPDDFLRHPLRSVRRDDTGALRGDDLYRVIAYGLQGPMPGYAHLGPDMLWAITHYVRSIAELRDTEAGESLLRSMRAWQAATE
jgi:mono/diheme cytochrome c family protein